MNLRRIKLTFLFVSAAELVNKIIPLLLIRFGQSRLGLESLGEAQFAIYIVELFLPIMTWGFELYGPISLRGIDKGSFEWKRRVGSIVGTRMFMGVLVYGLLLFSLYMFPKFSPYRPLATAIGAMMFLSSMSTTFVHTADQSMSVLARISIAAKFLTFIAIVLLVHRPTDGWLFAFLSYSVNLAIAMGSMIYVLKTYGWVRPRFDALAGTLKLSLPFALTYILAMLVERIETWFAEDWGGATAVGMLSGPLRLYQGLLFVIISVSGILYSEGLAYPEKVGRFLRFTVWVLAAFILPLMAGVFFIGEPLIVAISGEGFKGQGFNLSLICTGMLGHSLLLVAGVQALNTLGKVHWTNWAYFSALVIGTSGSALLMTVHEPSFALLAPALGKTMAGGALFWLACRHTEGFKNFRLPVAGIASGLVAMLIFLWWTPELHWVLRLLGGAGVYGVVFVGLSSKELRQILKKENLV